MQFIELSLRRLEETERVFLEIFSREPWNDAWSGERLRRYMLEIMGNDNSLSFGMEENGALVAIALGKIKHWYAGTEYLVEELGVLPAWQGRGVGSALLAGMRRVLKTKGVGTVVLLTDRTLPAYKFYIGKGFSEQKEQAFLVKEL